MFEPAEIAQSDLFVDFMDHIEDVEGFYSKDPSDRGGETYMGISRVTNPKWDGWLKLDEMSLASKQDLGKGVQPDIEHYLKMKVVNFYAYTYHELVGQLLDIPHKVALLLLSATVLMGESKAVSIMQMVLNENLLDNDDNPEYESDDYYRLKFEVGLRVDGILGRKTLKAIENYYGYVEPHEELFNDLKISIYCYLDMLCIRYQNNQKFYKGWINRFEKI